MFVIIRRERREKLIFFFVIDLSRKGEIIGRGADKVGKALTDRGWPSLTEYRRWMQMGVVNVKAIRNCIAMENGQAHTGGHGIDVLLTPLWRNIPSPDTKPRWRNIVVLNISSAFPFHSIVLCFERKTVKNMQPLCQGWTNSSTVVVILCSWKDYF